MRGSPNQAHIFSCICLLEYNMKSATALPYSTRYMNVLIILSWVDLMRQVSFCNRDIFFNWVIFFPDQCCWSWGCCQPPGRPSWRWRCSAPAAWRPRDPPDWRFPRHPTCRGTCKSCWSSRPRGRWKPAGARFKWKNILLKKCLKFHFYSYSVRSLNYPFFSICLM